jgi:hypothetical protein
MCIKAITDSRKWLVGCAVLVVLLAAMIIGMFKGSYPPAYIVGAVSGLTAALVGVEGVGDWISRNKTQGDKEQ